MFREMNAEGYNPNAIAGSARPGSPAAGLGDIGEAAKKGRTQ
jgi:hypothetical protein